MYIEFGKAYLRELYETGRCRDKKHRYQPEVLKKYVNCVRILSRSRSTEALYTFKGLNYEVLRGDKQGLFSVRIDRKYRLEFSVRQENGDDVVTICTLTDISNHYK